MQLWITISLAIALNTFARAVSCGAHSKRIDGGILIKTVTIMALGHFILFWIGGWAATQMDSMLYKAMRDTSFALLIIVGIKMVIYAIRERADDQAYDLNHTIVPVALALATGVDSFLSGMALSFVRISPLQPALATAIFVGVFVILGLNVGQKSGRKILKFRPGIIAGLVIITVAVLKYFFLIN